MKAEVAKIAVFRMDGPNFSLSLPVKFRKQKLFRRNLLHSKFYETNQDCLQIISSQHVRTRFPLECQCSAFHPVFWEDVVLVRNTAEIRK